MAQRGLLAAIDLSELEKLCMMQCTNEEIGAWFGVSSKTIERRRKNRHFADVMDRGRAKGRISVRRMQMKMLEQGNPTMGIWLGKQLLGQTDHIYGDGTGVVTYVVTNSLISIPSARPEPEVIDIGPE
jgi:hypothetical protein